MSVTVRPAVEGDFQALSRLDLTYPTGRYLHLLREGDGVEVAWRTEWRDRESGKALYATYTPERLQGARTKASLILTALLEGRPAGLLMVKVPQWTDAAEITDLAVDRPARRHGAGQALVEAAALWARERGYRSLWVEPRCDNADAIEFYVQLGFRISGFNDRMYSNTDDEPGKATLFMHLELSAGDANARTTEPSAR